MKLRLRTRILLWTFVPTAIIMSAVAFTVYDAYQQVTEDLVVGRNQQLTHLSARQLASDMNPYVDTLNSLARNPNIYGDNTEQRSMAIASAATQMQVFDGGIVLLDPHGRVMVAPPDHRKMLGEDWSNQGFFRQIMRGGAAAYSDVIPGDTAHSSLLAVGVPIVNGRGEFRGTLAGLFQVAANSTSAFYGGIVKLRLGSSGDTFLL